MKKLILMDAVMMVMLLAAAGCATVQPVDSFSELRQQVGRNVEVTTAPSGDVVLGQLVGVSPASLTVLDAGRRIVVDEARVRVVRQDWDDSIVDGASFGALVGLVPIILTQVLKTGSGDFNGSGFGALVVLPITAGAGIGALVDISHSGRGRVLYRAGPGRGIASLVISW